MAAQVVFQVVSQGKFLTKFQDPRFMEMYRMYVLREITEGALDTIRTYASRLWKNPTGALDQSWFSRYDLTKGAGFISNKKPYAYWLNEGVRAHRMRYLLHSHNAFYLKSGDKAAVIPIKAEGMRSKKGGTMFRVITDAHLKLPAGTGPWWHRGIEPKQFLAKGMEEYVQNKIQTDYEALTIRILNLQ